MKAFACQLDITPTRKIPLAGNENQADFAHIESKLEANILLVHESEMKLIVTLDLLYVGPELTHAIRRIAESYVKPENIWISASHTHNAPATDSTKPLLGRVDQGYLSWLCEEMAHKIQNLLENVELLEPVTPKLALGKAKASINRRRTRHITISRVGIKGKHIYMGPNRWGRKDSLIRRLDLVTDTDQIMCVLWLYACHPVSFFNELFVSSHYPGAIRNGLRMDLEEKIPTLFFQGFAGDVRPPSIQRFLESPRRFILEGPQFRLFTQDEYYKWTKKLERSFKKVTFVSLGRLKSLNQNGLRKIWSSETFIENSKTKNVVLQILPIGPICLVGLSAEPSVALSRTISELGAVGQVWPCGYLEDVYGYLPTKNQIHQGGYEVDGFCRTFECGKLVNQGWFQAKFEIDKYFAN